VKQESLLLKKSEHCSVIMNKFPYNSGHLLVIPNAHKGSLLDLTMGESQALHEQLRQCVGVLQKVFQCDGFNIGMNLGKIAGAGIPEHLHYHIIPRWGGDTNFFPLIAQTKVVPETLEQVYAKLAPAFAEVKL
jgi:ATP adenylyltransferase